MASCSNYQHRGRYRSCSAGSLRLPLAVLLLCCCHAVLSLREGTTQFRTHPMLFYGPEDVDDLRIKAKTTHKHIADVIAQVAPEIHARPKTYLPSRDYDVFASRWNEIYGNNLAALAMYCVLFPEDRQALDTALDYMDRMASLKQWQVKALMKDEVPVAHSLTGFATAYDFLYEHFDDSRRKTYIKKISDVTKELYDLSQVRGWGKQYLQNHVATNYLALLTGSLVLEVDDPQASVWKERAITKIEETMFVLNHVVDGSLDEGVAYGSYTSRSVTQYVYLALRHFNISHLENFWLKEHFWFYYSTILPGYQRTIGVADSNNNWFYGPESQLVFLDRYVLRNGSGNWLARLIRKHRTTEGALSSPASQRWCTLHTEFLWYDPSLGESPPQGHGRAHLHMFTDWGVVTYGSTLSAGADSTFLSFKSGSLHGKAVWNIIHRKMYPELVTVGWQNFNPGHEHPDQNSFVFAPAGQLFVTEALYGPKLTHLNNVLVFSPSKTSQCYQPWEGQLGECAKWLAWKATLVGDSSAELITADHKGDMVHISGEAAHAYHPSMGLKSVHRNLLLLNKELLLVVDHIEVTPESRLKQAAAFFHNVDKIFQAYKFGHYRGAKVETPVGDLRIFWVSDSGDTPWPMLETEQYPAEYQRRITHYVNVTMSLSRPTTRMAYVLMGPNLRMEEFKFVASERDGVQMMLRANGSVYHVSMATRHQDPVARATYLGFPGYAHIVKDGRKVRFGVKESEMTVPGATTERPFQLGVSFNVFFVITLISISLVIVLRQMLNSHQTTAFHYVFPTLVVLWLMCIIAVWTVCPVSICPSAEDTSTEGLRELSVKDTTLPRVVITSLPGSGSDLLSQMFMENPDFLYIQVPSKYVGVPRVEFEAGSFLDVCEWLTSDAASQRFPLLEGWFQSFTRDPMLHLHRQQIRHPAGRKLQGEGEFKNWFKETKHLANSGGGQKGVKKRSVRKKPTKNAEKQKESELVNSRKNEGERVRMARSTADAYEDELTGLLQRLDDFPNAQAVVHLGSGSWTLKMQWLYSVLKSQSRIIHVVRDPRAWVHAMTAKESLMYKEKHILEQVTSMFQNDNKCGLETGYAFEFEKLRLAIVDGKLPPHKLLAHVWAANMAAVLRLKQALPTQNYRLVKFENIVTDPLGSTESLHRFMGVPVPPATMHRMVQATRVKVFSLPFEEGLSQDSLNTWKRTMPTEHLQDIEEICGPIMRELGYITIMT
ncbi:dermatan-sulfate epimerase-like protein isoform X2 [Branchiostoma lanceolatum]|uniref:dermatan-sulfate epimerase-like protein isoform X1 n=1 Tax=Branchiostoma lanceolatum TaxID=7740 RepID=UPI0034514AD0